MFRRIAALLLPLLLLLPSGCVKGPKDSQLIFHDHRSMVQPRPDKGLVYFYRERTLACGYNYYVYDGFEELGGLACKSYFHTFLEPGRHRFWGKADFRGEGVFTIKPGQTYYIKVGTNYNEFGLPRSPSFTKVSDRVGREAVFSSTYVELR